MPCVATARLSGLVVLVTIALGVMPLAGDPFGGAGCAEADGPQLAASLTDLHQAVGDAMGSPSGCPLVDADGDTLQPTTTGLAVHHPNGTSVFVSGEQHWALTAQGLETWTGSWHNGLDPPMTPIPDQHQPEAAEPPLASIEAVTLVQVRQDAANTIVVEDAQGSLLTVETASGCPDLVAALGDHVFMRTGGTQTDLILLQQHEICAVAEVHAAEGN